jgi:hypothetical protein
MAFSVRELLEARLSTMEVPPQALVSPLFDSRVADEIVCGGVDVYLELPAHSRRMHEKVPYVRVDKRPASTGRRLVRTLPASSFSWRAREDQRLENVWALLGYLVKVGPIGVPLCAPEPLSMHGVLYCAFWTNLLEQECGKSWVLYLARFDSHRAMASHMVRGSHGLISEPVD